jgi:hypothetical protein
MTGGNATLQSSHACQTSQQCDGVSLVGVEFVNIAWPRVYAVSPDAPWWQLWAVPLVLGSILGITTLYVLINTIRINDLPETSSRG